MIYFNFGWAAE